MPGPPRNTTYTLYNSRNLKAMQSRYGNDFKCGDCPEPLVLGRAIRRLGKTKRYGTRFYHEDCWQSNHVIEC